MERFVNIFSPILLCYIFIFIVDIRYPEIHKMQGAKCAISYLVYGWSVCTNDNHSLNLMAHRPVHTDEPYTKLHIHVLKDPWTFIRCILLTI